MKTRVALGLAIVMAIGLSASSRAGEAADPSAPSVWTLTALERALRDSPPGPNTKASLRLARNEWESFQIAVRSSEPLRIADVAVREPSDQKSF